MAIHEIEEVFESALTMPNHRRVAYVRQVCKGNPELESEVLSLLDSFDEAPEFLLNKSRAEQLIQQRAEVPALPPKEFQPKAFGNYVLLRRMGVGGMAEIFHALVKGVGGFEKHVAIKSILPSLANDLALRDLFEKEARINSVLNHSNIAHVYDFLKAGNTYFLSMEFVAGKNLRQVAEKLGRTRMSPPLACYIVGEVAKGLAYAHAMRGGAEAMPLGIVHRDISPKNIMCSYDGEIKIVDFGIAKAREHMMADTQSLTLKGTFRYMSPEQAFGKRLDHRSDIFSAGLVLYELLKGEPLFCATELIQALNEIRAYSGPENHLEGDDLPPTLIAILKKALAPAPEDRYTSAGEFHQDLARHLRSLSFDAGYAHVSSFMQSVFRSEIQAERAQTTAAISAAKEKENEEAKDFPGSEKASGNIFVPVKLEATSLILPKPSNYNASLSSPMAPPPLQNNRFHFSWAVLGVLFGAIATTGIFLSRLKSPSPAEEPQIAVKVKEPEIPPPVIPQTIAEAPTSTPLPTVLPPNSQKNTARPVARIPHVLTLMVPRSGWEFFRGQTSKPSDFSWQDSKPKKAGKNTYTIEFSKDPSFETSTVFHSTEPSLSGKLILSFSPGHYYWRVRALSGSGESAVVSNPSFFEVRAAPLLSAPASRIRVVPKN